MRVWPEILLDPRIAEIRAICANTVYETPSEALKAIAAILKVIDGPNTSARSPKQRQPV